LQAAREEFIKVYLCDDSTGRVNAEELRGLPQFTLDTLVGTDLHAYDPDQAFALVWREQVIKRLGRNLAQVPLPPKADYPLRTLYNALVLS